MKKVLFALVLLTITMSAYAFDGSPQEDAPQGKSFFEIYVIGGGPIGWMIILLSVATFALIIEHFVTMQRDKLAPPEVLAQIEQILEEGNYEEAMNICDASKNYVTNVVGSALGRMQDGYEAMVSAAESTIEYESTKLTHKISWLNLCANIGPLMGLFGTVAGMVSAFTEIAYAAGGAVTPQQLAQGIYTALVTTVWGLIVAMPALGFYFVFKNRVQRLILELSGVAADLIERLKPVAK